jgi:hypothetical protein
VPTRKKQTTLDLELQVQDYLQNRSMRERSAGQEDALKGMLMNLLADIGELQNGGHRLLRLNEPLPYTEYKGGRAKQRSIAGIRRMRRASSSLNSDRAMAFLERKKLTKECTTTEVVINEDAILAATFEGRITDDELKLLYDERETYAFYLVDEGAEDDDDE